MSALISDDLGRFERYALCRSLGALALLSALVVGFGLACSSTPTHPSDQLTLRLTRAWRPATWSAVGAIRGRGPLRVALWRAADFKRRRLAERAWVRAETLRELGVDHAWGASGEPLLYREALALDGVGPRLKLNLYVGSRLTHPELPEGVDVIVPRSTLAARFGASADQLTLDAGGFVRADMSDVASADSEREEPRVDHPSAPSAPHLNRFRRWRFERAYQSVIMGARVDIEGETSIKWRRPRAPLPQALWILVDIAPPSEEPELLYVWLKPEAPLAANPSSRDVMEATTLVTRLAADVISPNPDYSARCVYQRPCPVRVVDVAYRFERCLNDSCTYRVSRLITRASAQ